MYLKWVVFVSMSQRLDVLSACSLTDTSMLQELTIQQSQYRALMHRNKDQTLDQLMLRNATGSTDVTALPLPFVLIQVRKASLPLRHPVLGNPSFASL